MTSTGNTPAVATRAGSPPSVEGLLDWDAVSDEVLAAISAKLETKIRRVSEALYDDLLTSAQDYFAENVRFNIAATVETANREAANARARAEAAEARLSALTAERDRMAALLEEARGYLGATQGPFAVALAQQIGQALQSDGRGE